MADDQKKEDFKQRLAAVLEDLNQNARKDPEALWLMGSLAGRIVKSSGKKNWPELKAALSRENYDSLLKTFETQGNELHKQGNEKAAYAVQAVAISLIASKMNDPDISRGDELLDQFINQTVKMYNKANTETPQPN